MNRLYTHFTRNQKVRTKRKHREPKATFFINYEKSDCISCVDGNNLCHLAWFWLISVGLIFISLRALIIIRFRTKKIELKHYLMRSMKHSVLCIVRIIWRKVISNLFNKLAICYQHSKLKSL